MSRTDYDVTNDAWKAAGVDWQHHRMTEAQARRMALALWRLAGFDRVKRVHVPPIWLRQGVRRLVHDTSHRVWRQKRPTGERRNHCTLHASWERSFTEHAIAKGWHIAHKPRPARPTKAPADPKALKRERAEAALKRWRTKAKRAATAIRKLERQLKRLSTNTAQRVEPTVRNCAVSLVAATDISAP